MTVWRFNVVKRVMHLFVFITIPFVFLIDCFFCVVGWLCQYQSVAVVWSIDSAAPLSHFAARERLHGDAFACGRSDLRQWPSHSAANDSTRKCFPCPFLRRLRLFYTYARAIVNELGSRCDGNGVGWQWWPAKVRDAS